MVKIYSIGLYEKAMPNTLTWEEKLICAKKAGYDFIEMSVDETDAKLARLEMTPEECDELLRLTTRIGMPIRSMCLSGHRRFPLGSHDDAIVARGMEIMQKAIILAERLGIRIIQLAGYDVYYETGDEETRARFAKNLRLATEMAAKAGVVLGFETMETEFMNTVEKSMYYVNEVGSPYLGVYPDIGNLTNAAKTYGTDVLEDLGRGEGHIFAMHLKETVPGVFREVPFGMGHVDFGAAVKAARRMGIFRFVTEFWYTGDPEWKAELSSVHDRFEKILDGVYNA